MSKEKKKSKHWSHNIETGFNLKELDLANNYVSLVVKVQGETLNLARD